MRFDVRLPLVFAVHLAVASTIEDQGRPRHMTGIVSRVCAGWTTFAESGGARQRGVTAWTVAATFRSCACLILSRRAIGTAARRASATAAVRGDARKGINKSQILTSDCVRAHASILEGCHAGRPPQVLTCRTICNTVYASCGLCATVLALEAWVAGSRP